MHSSIWRGFEREGRHDLLSVGTAAIGALLDRVLVSR
jgi:hypothetical protein